MAPVYLNGFAALELVDSFKYLGHVDDIDVEREAQGVGGEG